MLEPRMNQRRKVRITMVLELPVEWSLHQIRDMLKQGHLKPVLADEKSDVTIEEVSAFVDPNQLELETALYGRAQELVEYRQMQKLVQRSGMAMRSNPNYPPRHYLNVQFRLAKLYSADHYYVKQYALHEYDYHGAVAHWMEQIVIAQGSLGNVLDIGPAYGTLACYASKLGASCVTTIDKVPYLSKEVIDEYTLNSIIGDVERCLDVTSPAFLPPQTYDTIIMTEVLEHFNFHPVPTLMRIMSALRPGGRILISTPDQATWGKLTKHVRALNDLPVFSPMAMSGEWVDDHIWHYSKHDLENLLMRVGLKVRHWTSTKSGGGDHFNVMVEV